MVLLDVVNSYYNPPQESTLFPSANRRLELVQLLKLDKLVKLVKLRHVSGRWTT